MFFDYSAIPALVNQDGLDEICSKRKSKKRKSHKIQENTIDGAECFINCEAKKTKLSSYIENKSDVYKITNLISSSNDNIDHAMSKKKKKKKMQDLDNENQNCISAKNENINEKLHQKEIENCVAANETFSNELLPKENMICGNSTNENKRDDLSNLGKNEIQKNNSSKDKEYKCKGDLVSYVKKYPIPTITHEYLNEKKINIVKIDIVNKPTENFVKPTFETENRNIEELEQPQIVISNYENSNTNRLEMPLKSVESTTLDVNPNKTNLEVPPVDNENCLSNKNKQEQVEVTPECNPKRKFFFFNSSIVSPGPMNEETNKTENQKKEDQAHKTKYLFTMTSPPFSPKIDSKQPKNEDSNCEKILRANMENNETNQKVNENESNKNISKEDSCDISELFSSNYMNESSIHKSISSMSGLQVLPSSSSRSFFRIRQHSGLGTLLSKVFYCNYTVLLAKIK